MAALPFVLSVPHGGLRVPPEVADINLLTAEQIAHDGDEQATEIYQPLRDLAKTYVASDMGRAFIDMNRATDDRRKDGIVKTHTCWDESIYAKPLDETITARLIERYHRPYHERLSAADGSVKLGVDCHTMAAVGPPVGPDTGKPRPVACIGIGDGTCPLAWAEHLRDQLAAALGGEVTINEPFKGGHIIRAHAAELPWLMIELSRTPDVAIETKRRAIHDGLAALSRFIDAHRG